MRKRAYLRTITVRRMYGTHFRLHAERLSPKINVIYGTNGSGKTTIANAIQSVLLKNYVQAKKAAVDASLWIGDQEYRFDIDGLRRQCTQNGVECDWRQTPEPIRPESYHLSLHELLSAETKDSEFANAILREASGGFDISAAQKALDFSKPSLRRNKFTKNLADAQKQAQDIKRDQSSLFREKDRCKELEKQLQAAREAETHTRLLEKAIEWYTARQSWEEASGALEGYPAVIRRSPSLSNVEGEALELEHTIERLEEREYGKKSHIASLESTLSESPLPDDGLPDGVLETVASQIDTLRESGRNIQRLEEDLAGARQLADNAWEDLGGAPDAPEHFTREQVRRLRKITERATDLAGKREALDALQRALRIDSDIDPETESDRLRRAQDAFNKWLLARRGPIPRFVRLLLILSMAGSAALAAGLGLSGTPIALFAGLVVTVLIVWTYAQLTTVRAGSAEQSELKRIYPEIQERLDQGSVLEALESLISHRGDVAAIRAKQRRWEATADDRERLEASQKQLNHEREQFGAQTNLQVADSNIAGVYVLERLINWRKSDDAAKKLAAQYSEAQRAFASTLSELNARFSQFGQPEARDVHEASARLEDLRAQDNGWKRLYDKLENARSELEILHENLASEQRNYKKIFENLELEAGDFEGLRECAARHAEYESATKREVRQRAILDDKLRAVQNAPAFTQAVLQMDDLRSELAYAREQAAKRDELQDDIAKIKAAVQQAEEGLSLERALAAQEKAREKLAQEREKAAAGAVGEVLVKHLAERTRETHLPDVFRRAEKNFLKVTRGRYALEVRPDRSFGAFDNERELGLELNQLSSATRVQLLLCVRMAFVQEQELEYCLPITLDETLGNSDDERAREIIQTISDLADERQVFYFTAQQDEVSKWEELCGAKNINIVPLSELRPRTPVDPDALPRRALLPEPNGLSHADYGQKLRIPRWSGRDPVKSLHLWYLIEDTGQLHALLIEGVSTWGALQALQTSGLLELPDVAFKRLDLLARAVKSWQSGWQSGRGKPVDRAALEASGGVSPRFIEEVLQLCTDPGVDGSDLLHALKNNHIRGFGRGKIAELETYLQNHGFIAREKKLSDFVIRSNVLAEVAGDLANCELDHTAVDRMLSRIAAGP